MIVLDIGGMVEKIEGWGVQFCVVDFVVLVSVILLVYGDLQVLVDYKFCISVLLDLLGFVIEWVEVCVIVFIEQQEKLYIGWCKCV